MVLGSRAAMGYVLGRGAGAAAAQWWLSGGVSAANCVAAYQPKGAASLAASYSNLANPGTYDAAPGVAPTFDTATGWTFAAGQYLITGIDAATKPITMIVRATVTSLAAPRAYIGASNNGGYEFRANSGSSTATLYLLQQNVALIGGSTGTITVNANATVAATYSAAGAWALYIGGSTSGGGTNNKTMTSGVLWIGRGANGEQMIGSIQAVAIYNTTLSAAQVAAISSAAAAL